MLTANLAVSEVAAQLGTHPTTAWTLIFHCNLRNLIRISHWIPKDIGIWFLSLVW